MTTRLYHGSKFQIEKPVFGQGKPYNDYGLGFYCTESAELAKEWAVGPDWNGYANCYGLNWDGLRVLNLNSEPFTMLHWLSVLLKNREFDVGAPLAQEAKVYLLEHFSVEECSCDVIIGYRADDSYFSFAQDFINGTIFYRQLGNAMHLGKLGQQIVLKSKKAFGQLEYLGSEIALGKTWYEAKARRDQQARRDYFDLERNKRQRGDLYITQILDEEMMGNDPRLR